MKPIQWLFLTIFSLITFLTLLGVMQLPPFDKISPEHLDILFRTLLLEIIAVVIYAGWKAFKDESHIDHYKWQISYPNDLKKRFEKPYLSDTAFEIFYKKHEFDRLGEIIDDNIPQAKLDEYLDALFILKKAGEFANRTGEGDLYINRKGNGNGPGHGKAILVFPHEVQPIAFDVSTDLWNKSTWGLKFRQPDRYVKYEGRINTWRGGNLEVKFEKSNSKWIGVLEFDGVDVGTFSLEKM